MLPLQLYVWFIQVHTTVDVRKTKYNVRFLMHALRRHI